MRELALGIIITVLFVSLVILFCAILIRLYISKITTYNKILLEKEIRHQKQVSRSIIETQEQVLKNISRELHDDAGQQMTYLNFQLENLKLDSDEMREKLEPVSGALSQLSLSIRNLSHTMDNHILSQYDIGEAIAKEVERINKIGKIQVRFSLRKASKREFPPEEKIMIYRVFQEIINNCMKHSEAKEIKVELQVEEQFRLTISDNGKGFDAEKAKKDKPIGGLHNIFERAAAINYEIKINSGENKGCNITLYEKI